MGALKLAYYENELPLKVAYSKTFESCKVVQWCLRVDPITAKYPWYTPYQYAGNKPIWAVDLDGLEDIYFQNLDQNKADAIIKRINSTIVGAQIIADFKNTNCNKGYDAVFVPVHFPSEVKRTDAFVSQVFDKDEGVADPYTGQFRTAKEIYEQLDGLKNSQNEYDIESANTMSENLKATYGDFLENKNFVESLKKGRGIIVYKIDEETANVVDPNIPSTQKTASETTGHEIGAHGLNISQEIVVDPDKAKAVSKEHSNFRASEKEFNDQLNKSIKTSETPND